MPPWTGGTEPWRIILDKKWQIFFLVAVSIFMSTLDASIVNVALPYIMQDLSADLSAIQWVVVIYLLTVSSLLLTFGRLSDIKGRPLVYLLGFGFFTLGSFLCAVSGTVTGLVMARAVQGIGASMLMACSPALIVDAFEPESRGRALGLVGACVAAGLTVGPVVGGLLLEVFSWRSIFYINLPVGVAAMGYGYWTLRSGGRGSREPMDILGSIMMAVMVCSLIIGVTRSSDWGVFSLESGFCVGAGVGSGMGLVIHTRRALYPLFDLGLLKNRLFCLPLVASLILFASLFSMVFMMPFYLSLAHGFSPARTGGVMIVPFLFLLVVSPISGAASDRFGSRMLCGAGMACLALGLLMLGFLSPGSNMIGIVWRLALVGMGTALFISPNSTAVMGAVPVERRGIASGAVATARNLGMVLGVAMASTIFTTTFSRLSQGVGLDSYTPAMAPFFMAGFKQAMTAGAFLAFTGILVSLVRGPENPVQ